jgi:hypothetical protein
MPIFCGWKKIFIRLTILFILLTLFLPTEICARRGRGRGKGRQKKILISFANANEFSMLPANGTQDYRVQVMLYTAYFC